MRFESVMAVRNKLEELGKAKGVIHAEKGVQLLCTVFGVN